MGQPDSGDVSTDAPLGTRRRRKKKRTEMLSFKINEISGVDRPAQEPALVALMKRAGPDELTKLDGNFGLTSSEEGHSHLVDLDAKAGTTSHATSEGEEFGHSHPYVISPEGKVTIGESSGHKHTIARTTMKGDPEPSVSKDAHQEDDAMSGDATATKDAGTDLAELRKKNEDLEGQLALAKALGSLCDEERAHYRTLDKEAGEDFLTMTDDARATVMDGVRKAAQDANPVVYTSERTGETFRKNDDPRLTAMAKREDEQAQELAKERKARLDDRLEKRAGEEMPNLPGEATVKVELLRAIEGISDDDTRKGALELLKAANTSMGKAFDRLGTSLDGNPTEKAGSPEAQLEALAKKMVEDSGGKIDIVKARVDVLETPEGAALYQKSIEG